MKLIESLKRDIILAKYNICFEIIYPTKNNFFKPNADVVSSPNSAKKDYDDVKAILEKRLYPKINPFKKKKIIKFDK